MVRRRHRATYEVIIDGSFPPAELHIAAQARAASLSAQDIQNLIKDEGRRSGAITSPDDCVSVRRTSYTYVEEDV